MKVKVVMMKVKIVTFMTVLPSPGCKARLATSGEFAVKRSDGADEVQAEDDDDFNDDDDDEDDDNDDDNYNDDDDDDFNDDDDNDEAND